MGITGKISLAVIALGLAFLYQTYHDLSKPHERPELGKKITLKIKKEISIAQIYFSFEFYQDLNEFLGQGDAKAFKEDKTIKPFKISYSAEVDQTNEYLLSIF